MLLFSFLGVSYAAEIGPSPGASEAQEGEPRGRRDREYRNTKIKIQRGKNGRETIQNVGRRFDIAYVTKGDFIITDDRREEAARLVKMGKKGSRPYPGDSIRFKQIIDGIEVDGLSTLILDDDGYVLKARFREVLETLPIVIERDYALQLVNEVLRAQLTPDYEFEVIEEYSI